MDGGGDGGGGGSEVLGRGSHSLWPSLVADYFIEQLACREGAHQEEAAAGQGRRQMVSTRHWGTHTVAGEDGEERADSSEDQSRRR